MSDSPGDGDRPAVVRLRTTLWERIAPGFHTRADMVDWAREDAESDDETRVTADESEAVVHEVWARREAELAARPGRGDDAKVEEAFAALEAQGIVAEMHCGVDQADGNDLCRTRAGTEGRSGFVFFHEQDAERLAWPDPVLLLGFDAVAPKRLFRKPRFESQEAYDEAARVVGRQVVAALEEQGLVVDWNGSPTARPLIRGVDWRRPLPPDD